MFLTLLVIGLVGLGVMALPALGGHHPLGGRHPFGGNHALGGHHHLPSMHGPGQGHGHPAEPHAVALVAAPRGVLKFMPSPRALFSLCALYGAFGNALVHAAHLSNGVAAVVAIPPALLVERLLIRPVWNLLFRFQADASTPLEQLILAEARAVVPFRNGRGLITTVRDGRRVQLNARLRPEDAARPVVFGQRLRIEDVDARRERVTVSVIPNEASSRHPT